MNDCYIGKVILGLQMLNCNMLILLTMQEKSYQWCMDTRLFSHHIIYHARIFPWG